MDGRYDTAPFLNLPDPRTSVSPDARIEEGATITGPCFIDEGVLIKSGARVGPYSVIGRQTQIEEDASIEGAILWPNCHVSREASVRNAILGRHCHLGRNVSVDDGAVLGDRTTLTDYTRA
jgi:NDP-sugar pyrophosphorylase family protein